MLAWYATVRLFLPLLGESKALDAASARQSGPGRRIEEGRPLGSVADDEVGEALELLWGTAAGNTWNARRAAVLSWLGWCQEYGYDGPAVPAWDKAADANGEVPAQGAGEPAPLLQMSPEAIAEVTSLFAPGNSRR